MASGRALARRLAVVTQREEPAFPLGVREYVALGRYPHLGLFRGAGVTDTDAIARAVERTEIAPYLDRAITELSGGEWQRVRLARALAQGGEALVLDEPTTFLDVGHEMAVFELLAQLASDGQAVLLVSHQLNLVARFAASHGAHAAGARRRRRCSRRRHAGPRAREGLRLAARRHARSRRRRAHTRSSSRPPSRLTLPSHSRLDR